MTLDDAYAELIDYLNSQDEQPRVRKKHRLPIECYAASDCEFFFTICARHQRQPFADAKLASCIIESLLWRKRRHNWTMFCYCLMPNHLHFIVRPPERSLRLFNAGVRQIVPKGILDEVGEFKSYTTTQIWWKHGGAGPLWQESSYDHVFRYKDSLESAVYYVLNNPVRKNLAKHWEDYPYSRIVDPL